MTMSVRRLFRIVVSLSMCIDRFSPLRRGCRRAMLLCVFITAVPITKLFAGLRCANATCRSQQARVANRA
jgi:hypothetical protein